jgi:hypothetical protein
MKLYLGKIHPSQEGIVAVGLAITAVTSFIAINAFLSRKIKEMIIRHKTNINPQFLKDNADAILTKTRTASKTLPYATCIQGMKDSEYLCKYLLEFLKTKNPDNMNKMKDYIKNKMLVSLTRFRLNDTTLEKQGWSEDKLISLYTNDYKRWIDTIIKVIKEVHNLRKKFDKKDNNGKLPDGSNIKQFIKSVIFIMSDRVQNIVLHTNELKSK